MEERIMKTTIIETYWNDLDDIMNHAQTNLNKEHCEKDAELQRLFDLSLEIRELCINSKPLAKIIIMESPF